MDDKYIAGARARFANVMASRKSSKELVALLGKLSDSDKFSPHAKPYCYADLLLACSDGVTDSNLEDLLVAISNEWAGDLVRRVYPNEADAMVSGIVRRALEIATKDETVERRLALMRFGGLIRNNEHALQLAIAAGMPPREHQRLADALLRLAAKPKVEEPCPF